MRTLGYSLVVLATSVALVYGQWFKGRSLWVATFTVALLVLGCVLTRKHD